MKNSYSIQAAWNGGDSFTAQLSADFGTCYAVVPVNDVYELRSVGAATVPTEIQVRNDVAEIVSITCFADGDPLLVQSSVAHGEMALFAMKGAPSTTPTVNDAAPVRVEYVNATDDTFDAVLIFTSNIEPSFDAIAAAWRLIQHVPPGGGSTFQSPRIPLDFGLVRNVFESIEVQSASMSASFTKIDLTNANDSATVKLVGNAAIGYSFVLSQVA
jgi:hypothetical protein